MRPSNGMVKPHISRFVRGVWQCNVDPAAIAGREITGLGTTPAHAYADWKKLLAAALYPPTPGGVRDEFV